MIIRLADIYLMEAEALEELCRAQALLDAVRSRVTLPSVPVSMDATEKQKGRLEWQVKGHRFFDLVRWETASFKTCLEVIYRLANMKFSQCQ